MSTDKQFTRTDHPISVEVPLTLPKTEPVAIELFEDVLFGHAPKPATSKVTLPEGEWEKVVLTITGTQEGRQYDRIMHVFVDNMQLFTGCTPEPSKGGIEWKIEKDITLFAPILKDEPVFTMILDNYLSDIHTGIPLMSASLSFYPKTEDSKELEPWEQQIPDAIVPIVSEPKPHTLSEDQTMTVPLTLDDDIKEIYLDLYAVHQNNDEFYWGKNPAFREVEIYFDGMPAGVVWPDPILYTGGVNPLFYRPITGLRSMDIPSFRLNLTPFAGLLGGEHELEIRIGNNMNYWLISGSLLIHKTDGEKTTGKIISNSLEFPSESLTTEEPIQGAEKDRFITEAANKEYTIVGEVETKDGKFTTKVQSKMQFSNDATNYVSAKANLVHAAQSVETVELVTKDNEEMSRRQHDATFGFDCTSAYLGNANEKELTVPSSLTQSFTDSLDYQSKELESPYHSNLKQNYQGYAVLQRGPGITDVAQASVSANLSFQDSQNESYQDTLMTRGGVVKYRKQTKNGQTIE